MDHGTLTDNNGRRADFRNVIIVMTSNVGAKDTQRNRPGFFAQDVSRLGDDDEAFKRTFSPEFRNRLHARVRFAPLSPEVCELVAHKQCNEVIAQLAAREVELRLTERAIKTVAHLGYDPLNGARPMQRILRDKLKRTLADELLFGVLSDGGAVLIDASDEWIKHLDKLESIERSETPSDDDAGDQAEAKLKRRQRVKAPRIEAPLRALYNDEASAHSEWEDAFTGEAKSTGDHGGE